MNSKIIALLFFVLLGLTTLAQESDDKEKSKDKDESEDPAKVEEEPQVSEGIVTLLGSDDCTLHGGYGALTMGYSRIRGRVKGNDALILGGRGAWLVNHQFGIGLAGEMIMSEEQADELLGSNYFFSGGYGGMILEYILLPRNPIHAAFPLLVGAGGISYSRGEYNPGSYNDPLEDSNAYFIVEPGVELDMNMAKFIRMSLGIYYRYTTDINLVYFKNGRQIEDPNFMRGLSAKIVLKFGKF